MKKLYIFRSQEGSAPILEFMDALEPKARRKLEQAFMGLALGIYTFKEPQIKHFNLERYRQLFELREKARVVLRVIFTLDREGNIILLHPFIKRQTRNTMQALDTSLGMLEEIRRAPGLLREYPFNQSTEEEKTQ